MQFGRVPVVAALHGAVVGGGLELASASHIRVADESTFYALPEGTRGIFVGGGGSVRIPKLIGVARMTDMMMTGRVYNAQDGERLGFAQYLVPSGESLGKAIELATRIATNAPLTNFALMHALPRIAEQPADHGFLTESMLAAIAQSAQLIAEGGAAGLLFRKGLVKLPSHLMSLAPAGEALTIQAEISDGEIITWSAEPGKRPVSSKLDRMGVSVETVRTAFSGSAASTRKFLAEAMPLPMVQRSEVRAAVPELFHPKLDQLLGTSP